MSTRCHLCGNAIERPHMAYVEITGYTRHRSDGGANHVHLKRETGSIACTDCIEKKKLGVDENQLTLA